MLETQSVHEVVRQMELDDRNGETQISKYVSFNFRETIEKIEAYINSKHISGETDYLGRKKPFFNIVTAAVNIWYRATDIDRKNILIGATKSKQTPLVFIQNILLDIWMKKIKFGVFLNDWGRTLAKYCSAVSKFVEKDGTLYCEVVPWNRIICDAVNFEENPVIEKLWFTPAMLRKEKRYDQEMVERLIDNQTTRKTMSGLNKDNKSGFILVYEIHGEFSKWNLTDEESDKDTYSQQMHVVSFTAKKDNRKEFDDYTLFKGKEEKSPYLLDHLIKEDDRVIGIGAVENLFQAQWMVNDSAKQIKDQLELASKMLFQTADGNFVGQNAQSDLENGDILIHALNSPLTLLNNKPDIAAMQSFGQQWQSLGNQINGIADAMIMQAKSGTAWRQTQAELQEAHSLFEIMIENKGLAIERMLREFIIPFGKKQMDTSEEIAAILEDHQITQLDAIYVPNETIKRVNQKKKDIILSGQIYDTMNEPMDMATEQAAVQQEQNQKGNKRFFAPSEISTKSWKEVLKDIEWEVDVDTTGENKDKQAILETINSALLAVTNPNFVNNPKAQFLVNKVLTLTGGVSPLELSSIKAQPMPAMMGAPAEAMNFNIK